MKTVKISFELNAIKVLAIIAVLILTNGVFKGTQEPNVTFNGGYCIECGGTLEETYHNSREYNFKCEECGHNYYTHI